MIFEDSHEKISFKLFCQMDLVASYVQANETRFQILSKILSCKISLLSTSAFVIKFDKSDWFLLKKYMIVHQV